MMYRACFRHSSLYMTGEGSLASGECILFSAFGLPLEQMAVAPFALLPKQLLMAMLMAAAVRYPCLVRAANAALAHSDALL